MAQSEDFETEIYEWAKVNASASGYKLNPDYDIVMTAIKGLANNKKKYGEMYCSCREISGDKEKDKKIICPCVYRSKDMDRKGSCKCALYVK
jgi:ferredoxin-thioredoxin reductase catalytic subunit